MDATQVNADRSRLALESGATLPWRASPEPGVMRKLLERDGGEVALATSIVRYAAGSRFASHRHDAGEEFLVLDGVFSDACGDYASGTYVRNPPGSSHAPFSASGCVIFVKLRQMKPDESDRVVVAPEHQQWLPTEQGERAELYRSAGTRVALERLPAGAHRLIGATLGGEEILVLAGEAVTTVEPSLTLVPWSWARSTPSHALAIRTRTPVTLWVKQGHLPLESRTL
jgi:anti-sigma factor ChrR (cupin superfamily)